MPLTFKTLKRLRSVGTVVVVATFTSLFLAGCRDRPHYPSTCYRILGEQEVFIGTYECISKGSREELTGYWHVGFERSLFFKNLEDLNEHRTAQAYWVELKPELDKKLLKLLHSEDYHVLPVKITGWRSEQVGFYGHGYTKELDSLPVAGGIAADTIEVVYVTR